MSRRTPAGAQVVNLCHYRAGIGFTSRDLAELESWETKDRSATLCHGETGPFAMLYDGALWASFAVVRQGGELLVWDCVTFADIGRFASMRDALAALTRNRPAAISVSLSTVIAFPSRGSAA